MRPSRQLVLEELARFPELNPGPVLHMDAEGIVLLANAAARDFFPNDTLVGASWLARCDGLDEGKWRNVLDQDERLSLEVERNGRCAVFTHVRSPYDESVYAFGADITKRRRAERELAEHAATLAEVARFPDMNPGPVLRLDLTGCVMRANTAALKLFGESLAGRSWLSILPAVSGDLWPQIVEAKDIIDVEARVGDRDFVFAHRRDHKSELVFVFGADVSALKHAQRALQQSEKLATLGTLAAGVAHELNNPAAAAKRAADHLREALLDRERAQRSLDALRIPEPAQQLLHALDLASREGAGTGSTLSSMKQSDLESDVEEWLDERGVDDAWQLAPALVAQGLTRTALDELAAVVPRPALASSAKWLAAGRSVGALVHEIGEGSSRISEIVQALKSYAYLGQAPVQAVDLRVGLESTLVILRSKLREGITVNREYDAELPHVPAYGSELNQVWTNLIDNAAGAMNGTGTITIRTRRDGAWAVVDIVDSGPGIPENIQSRVFDPFFTTKEPGKGTGLGLSTCYSIITEKHHGRLSVESRPGRTCFAAMLPLESPAATAASAADALPTHD